MSKTIIKRYLIFTVLFNLGLSFFFATYQLFLVSRGVNFLQMNLINLCFMIGVFVLEIPTGAIADYFGRQKSVTAGCFITGLSFLTYFFGNTFWVFVLAELIGALGVSLMSGALEAWVVDSLRFADFDGQYEEVFKKENNWRRVGIIIGSIVGAKLAENNLAIPWLLSTIGMGLMGFYTIFFLSENYFVKNTKKLSIKAIGKIASSSVQYGLKRKAIMYVIIFGAILLMSFQATNMYWPIVLQKTYGLKTAYLGWIFAGFAMCMIIGAKLSTWFQAKIGGERRPIILSQIVTLTGMILSALMLGKVSVVSGLFINEVGRGIIEPLKQSYLNRKIDTTNRATVLSFDSMIGKAGSGLGLIVSGLLANHFSIATSWIVMSLFLGLGIIIFYRLKNGD